MNQIFISYSHNDEKWKEELVKNLKVAKIAGHLSYWQDRDIKPGADWYPEIEKALQTAQIIIMLISADFLISPFILSKEVPVALKRREKEGVTVIPLLISPCPWKTVEWLSAIQMWPRDCKALSAMSENDYKQSLTDLTIIKDLNKHSVTQPPPPISKKPPSPNSRPRVRGYTIVKKSWHYWMRPGPIPTVGC